MKFFFLEEAMRSEETGNQYPQILKMSKLQDFDDDKGVYVFSRVPIPENDPDLKYLILDKEARITDVLSAEMLSLNGFLINEKVRNVTSKYNLPEHRFYEAFVLDRLNKEYRYYWLQMVVNYDLKYINFTESGFILTTTSIIKKLFAPIEISSYDDYKEKQSKLDSKQIIKVTKAVLNDDYIVNPLDIFKIPALSASWIISDRLRATLTKDCITGVRIIEADKLQLK